VRLDAVALPDTSDGGGAQAQVLGQRARSSAWPPMRRRLDSTRNAISRGIQFDLLGNSHRVCWAG